MKFESGLEPISEILGPAAQAGHRAPSGDLFSTTLTSSVRVHQTFRLTARTEQLPHVVIPSEFDLDEFFATVATYYPGQSPLTSYVHILGKELVKCFDPSQAEVVPDSHSLSRCQLARLGACLGETALAALNSAEGALTPSYSACKRSLGYALSRAAALYPNLDAGLIAERWERLRRLTGLAVSQTAVRTVCSVNAAAGRTTGNSEEGALAPPLRSALVTHISESHAHDALQRAIFECYSGLSGIALEIDGPFDGRMSVFLKVVEEVQRATRGTATDSFAVGYFCNRILPGSFAHSKVLTRLTEFFPNALIWYGMFCSTSPGFDARHFGSGLFAKLERDISQPFSFAQRPQCDLSLDELDVLMRAPLRADAIKPIQQKIAAVALLPGLDVLSRFTPDEDAHAGIESPSSRIGASDERLIRAGQLLDEAVMLVHELSGTHQRSSPAVSNSRRQRKK